MSELIDNGAERVKVLKEVVLGLHRGDDMDSVRAKMVALVRQCDASDVAAMEPVLLTSAS